MHISRKRRLFAAILGLAAAAFAVGCDSTNTPLDPTVVPSTSTQPASISVSATSPLVNGVVCSTGSVFSPNVTVVFAASAPVNVDRVSFQMIDGSNLGGPTITIPQPSLASQFGFGFGFFAAGTSRVLVFHPQMPCVAISQHTIF